jgi:hypothetical protein
MEVDGKRRFEEELYWEDDRERNEDWRTRSFVRCGGWRRLRF